MASEITLSGQLGVINGNISWNRQVNGARFNQNAQGYAANVQNINTIAVDTAGTAITVPASIAALGMAFLRNQDPTNFVTIGIRVGGVYYPFKKIKAGEFFPDRLVPGVTYYASADTAAVALEWVVLED